MAEYPPNEIDVSNTFCYTKNVEFVQFKLFRKVYNNSELVFK